MILKQYYLDCLAHASYLVADEDSGRAAIVDPQRDVEQYLEDAARLGLRIEHVFLTHFHADFLAGHLELQARTGATIHLGAAASAEFSFEPVDERASLSLGRVRLAFLETPGHTPESISILVFDEQVDRERPSAVLTGDTLFVGDVGRPDLLASIGHTSEELAAMLYRSLHEKLLALPDETRLFPAHGAGSLCGKNLGEETSSTIGQQRRHNPALQPMSEEAFVALVSADQPAAPQYFVHDAILNRKHRELLDEALERELQPLSCEQVVRLQNGGAVVLDTRDSSAFAKGHLASAWNVGLDGRFATWAGSLLPPDRSLVLVTDPGRAHEAALRLGRIGYDNVVGYLDRPMDECETDAARITVVAGMTATTLAARLAGQRPPLVVDVRQPGEWSASHLPGSTNLPLSELADRLEELPLDRDIVLYCASGYRSSAAASVLDAHGRRRHFTLVGGLEAWDSAIDDDRHAIGIAEAGGAAE